MHTIIKIKREKCLIFLNYLILLIKLLKKYFTKLYLTTFIEDINKGKVKL